MIYIRTINVIQSQRLNSNHTFRFVFLLVQFGKIRIMGIHKKLYNHRDSTAIIHSDSFFYWFNLESSDNG